MADVIILDGVRRKRQEDAPHLQGPAKCVQCDHKWEGVAPVGVITLQCPSCFSNKGVFTQFVEYKEPHWQCDCGNQFFAIGQDRGVYCPHCGDIQKGFT
jgi:Zn finger protein HypA/HybF involved in hydrogenase expression